MSLLPRFRYQIGDTRGEIRCQDAFKFLAGLPDESQDLIVTDPPYSGMNQHLKLGKGRIVGEYGKRGKGGKWFAEIVDTPENYSRLLSEFHRVLKPDRHIFIMFDPYSLLTLAPLVRGVFNVKNVITWDKVHIGMGHYFRRQSEFILFACKGKRPLSSRSMSDVWSVPRVKKAAYPTQKPDELFGRMIRASRLDWTTPFHVCDPFVGSGSSAQAALEADCYFLGADSSKEAFDVCRSRLREVLG